MKKILLVFILFYAIIVSTSCTIAPALPTDGMWHNEELKLVISFEESTASVYSYDENLSYMDLQLRNWIDGGFDIIHVDADGAVVEIYSGWRKYASDNTFTISLYAKADPENDFKTQIELDEEDYVFIRVDSYEEIN